jgi:nucleoside-diphosphate-sugar epimerase
MRILILGGTKFFGKAFATTCSRKGHDVTVFSRSLPADLPEKIKQIKGNRADLSPLKNTKWDFVLDNICYIPAEMKEAIKIFSGNVKHYVFLSTGDVHLTVLGAASPFSESIAHKLPPRKGKIDAYGKGKYEAEKLLIKSALPYSIARFPVVIGKGDPKDRLAVYLRQIMREGIVILPEGGKYRRRFIYIKDTTSALTKIMANRQKALGKIFHFGDKAVTLKHFINLCFKYCGRKPLTIDIPAARLKKQGYNFAKDNPYFNSFDYVLSIRNAKLLGWKHSPAEKWLKEAVALTLEEIK